MCVSRILFLSSHSLNSDYPPIDPYNSPICNPLYTPYGQSSLKGISRQPRFGWRPDMPDHRDHRVTYCFFVGEYGTINPIYNLCVYIYMLYRVDIIPI